MHAEASTRLRGREIAAERNRRRAQDMSIAVGLIVRSVPAIDDLVRALEGAGGCVRFVGALRSELARRRGAGR
jgi:hypothetical protein